MSGHDTVFTNHIVGRGVRTRSLWTLRCSCGWQHADAVVLSRAQELDATHRRRDTQAPAADLVLGVPLCAGECGLARAPGDIYCAGCRSGRQRQDETDPPTRE